jgi:hypothetical protein
MEISSGRVESRVARWFVFKPKIQIWVNFGGPCKGKWKFHQVEWRVQGGSFLEQAYGKNSCLAKVGA